MKRRNMSGPITEPCGTPLRIGVVPESSPPTCTLNTRSGRYASIHRTTTPHWQKDFSFLKINLWLTESKVDDINCVAFVHHARHRFFVHQEIGETGPTG